MAALDVQDLNKSFGSTEVLRDVSIAFKEGEFVSLVGPSGCGKSTLLRIIAGLEQANSGSVLLRGKAVDHLRPSERDLAMVFQSYALYPHLTVAENIAVPLRLRRLNLAQRLPLIGRLMPGSGKSLRSIDQHVGEVAHTLNLSALLKRKPAQLSGGQRQRVALGRALVREPAAYLLDEPLSNLDAKLRVQLRAEITQLHQRLRQQSGTSFIYVTHDQAEAMTMSDRIAVMDQGQILQYDTPETVYSRPVNLTVASFIGSPMINVLSVECDSHGLLRHGEHVLGSSTALEPGSATLGVRPEAIKLVAPDQASLVGTVRTREHLGAETFVHVVLDGQTSPIVARVAIESEGHRQNLVHTTPGTRCGLRFSASAAHLFNQNGDRVDAKLIAARSALARFAA